MAQINRPVVLITGVSGDIGKAAARVFASSGWVVVGTVRKATGRRSAGIDIQPAEMTRPADLARIIAHVTRKYGQLDALVCNAGYGLNSPLEKLTYAQMRDQLAVNTLAPAELTRLALPLLVASGGVAVGVSSIVGQVGWSGFSLYAASKHALEGLYESLSLEYADGSVRFKLIEPSGVNTSFWENLKSGSSRAATKTARRSHSLEASRHDYTLTPERVAAEIYKAAQDRTDKLRYPVGLTSRLMLARRLLPSVWFRRLLRKRQS